MTDRIFTVTFPILFRDSFPQGPPLLSPRWSCWNRPWLAPATLYSMMIVRTTRQEIVDGRLRLRCTTHDKYSTCNLSLEKNSIGVDTVVSALALSSRRLGIYVPRHRIGPSYENVTSSRKPEVRNAVHRYCRVHRQRLVEKGLTLYIT